MLFLFRCVVLTDPEVDAFTATFPKQALTKFEQSIAGPLYFATLSLLVFPIMLAAPVGKLFGNLLNLPFTFRVVVGISWVFVWGMIFAMLFRRFSQWHMRRKLMGMMVDGRLKNCPVCMQSQLRNSLKHCSCGCLVRPFQE